MDNFESLCRIICKAQGTNPDAVVTGHGYIFKNGVEYSLWQTRSSIAQAIIDAGWKPPKKRKEKNVTN